MINSQNINEIVGYQAGSVVSKEIINKPTGTVTLFAFDLGQGLSEHTAPYDALIVVTDGVALVTIEGIEKEVRTGEMIVMPANFPHTVKAIQSMKMILIMIK